MSAVGLTSAVLLLTIACAPNYGTASWTFVQQARTEAGIAPLEWDSSLFPIADERARYIAEHLAIDHDQVYFDSHEADHAWKCEVTGRQPLIDPGQHRVVLDAIGFGWINSPEHRDCVLGEGFKRAAISAYTGSDGRVYEVMWLTD